MARHRYQAGWLFVRGKKRKVYVLRYYEPALLLNEKRGHIKRSVVLGLVSEIGGKKQARVIADGILRRLNLGQARAQSVRTLADFAQHEWAPTILPTLKFSTQRQYKFLLDTHILPALGKQRLCDLSREQLQAFLTAKLRAGLAWETVAHMKHALSRVIGVAVEWGYLSENVIKLAKLPRRPPAKPRLVLSEEQVRQLLGVLDEPARTIVLLVVMTGCRIGEVLALRWRHIDLERGVLHIRDGVYLGHFDTPKTPSSVGDLPLGPETVAALWRHRKRSGGSSYPDALVFPNEKAGPLDAHNLLWRMLYPACNKAGIPRVSWHPLRHTHGTLLNAQGESPKTIQTQLRHSSARITLETYVQTLPEQQRQAVERLEGLVIGPKRPQIQEVGQQTS